MESLPFAERCAAAFLFRTPRGCLPAAAKNKTERAAAGLPAAAGLDYVMNV